MAKKEQKPVQIINLFEYKGRVLPIEALNEADRRKCMARASLPAVRLMNPGWDVELKPEAYEIDLDEIFRDAPTEGSLYRTKEAQERADAPYKGVWDNEKDSEHCMDAARYAEHAYTGAGD